MPFQLRSMFGRRYSFSTKLILILSIANLLILSISGFITYQVHLSLFNQEISRQYAMTNQQVLARLDSRVKDMYRITDYITLNPIVKQAISGQTEDMPPFDRMLIERELDKQLLQVRLDAPEIMGVRIYDLKGNITNVGTFASHFIQLDQSFLAGKVKELEGTSGEYLWSRIAPEQFHQNAYRNWILAGRLMRSTDLDTYGVMLILFNSSLFESYLKDMRMQGDTGAYLFDQDGGFLYSLDNEEQEHSDLPAMEKDETLIRKENGTSYLYTKQISDRVRFSLYSKVSLKQIQNRSWVILQVAIISALASIVCYWVIILIVSKKLLRPLKSLVYGMKRVRDGAFDTRVNIKTKDELAFIGESFNQMTHQIDTLIREVYQRELSEKEAELKAIQAQLNPHFLYNTLGMFFWKFYGLNDEKSAQLVNSLSEMLQYTLEPVQKLTTLRDEMKQLENYFNIQQARYQEALSTDIQIPLDLHDCRIIRLLFQPIVENAFVHAFRDKKSDRRLTIRSFRQAASQSEPDFLIIEITDNGCGMDASMIQRIIAPSQMIPEGDRERIGTSSVIRRINLVHGEPYGVDIFSKIGDYTTVRLRLPYQKAEEEEQQ
ncbi:histidine kinase [Paenibacillus alkaliterrae]|uniref:sensor histidine kinase n=1 Tax=Paenibacillus alkaliterrae TaxID=320909 RepID=UPI001F15BBA2|nr:histidine kinase [Paenibacillus alkaliterrae]MCF2939411.1 histidine kinase [Paenibacillus alkaliterrae]